MVLRWPQSLSALGQGVRVLQSEHRTKTHSCATCGWWNHRVSSLLKIFSYFKIDSWSLVWWSPGVMLHLGRLQSLCTAVTVEVAAGENRREGEEGTGNKIWDQALKMSCRKKKSCLWLPVASMGHYQQIINLCHRVRNRRNTYISGG